MNYHGYECKDVTFLRLLLKHTFPVYIKYTHFIPTASSLIRRNTCAYITAYKYANLLIYMYMMHNDEMIEHFFK